MTQAVAAPANAAGFVNPFEGFDEADPSGSSGIYFTPGKYKAQISMMKYIPASKSFKKVGCCVTEFKILQSDNPQRPIGTTVGWVVMENSPFYHPNLKAMLLAAFAPEDPKHVNKEVLLACVDPVEQAAAGLIVDVVAVDILTKEKKPFTKLGWSVNGSVYAKEEATAA